MMIPIANFFRKFRIQKYPQEDNLFSIVTSEDQAVNSFISYKQLLIISLLIISTNYVTYSIFKKDVPKATLISDSGTPLYLIDKAQNYIEDLQCFEEEVRRISSRLNIPPEWLMAVIYFESKFNPSVKNYRGSGAVGLIQFMLPSIKDMNQKYGTKWYLNDIQKMSATQQLTLVENYLEIVQERYGEFQSLTDLYLGILYPKAIMVDANDILFSSPSKHYRQNIGLDFNKDGHISKGDIENYLRILFPSALSVRKTS